MRRKLLLSVVIGLVGMMSATGRSGASESPEVRAFWVDAFNPGIKTAGEVDTLIDRVLQANANTIIAQVRRRGDSYYLNSIEPFVEDPNVTPGFDPLGYLIDRAHAAGLEVHAWIIANAIYNGHPYIPTAAWPCRVPCSSTHVFNQHGFFAAGDENWLTRTHPSYTGGTSRYPATTGDLIPFGWRLTDGNWYLDPGHPSAAEYTVGVVKHLVGNYDIDGLHLDRIRYPEMPISRASSTSPIGFSTGYNPVSVRRFNETYGRPAESLPLPWDGSWSDWRREQMNALVRRIYLETIAIKPHVKVSASTITFWRGPNVSGGFDKTEAYYRVFQDWDGWTRHGFLDLNIPMVYKPVTTTENITQFSDWAEFTRTHQYNRHAAIGLGVYLNTFEQSIGQLFEARMPSPATSQTPAGLAYYSYATTNRVVIGIPDRPHTEFFRALSEDGAYVDQTPNPSPVTIPVMPWKATPRHGYVLAQILGADGRPADGAVVTLHQLNADWRATAIQQSADGNGYVGSADLPPGAYQLAITTPGGTEFVTLPSPVLPGVVSRWTIRLRSDVRGPMIRPERRGVDGPRDAADVSPLEYWREREPIAEEGTGGQ
jgi:uncharacterized lipoprotein YddW (UPF0748 family)